MNNLIPGNQGPDNEINNNPIGNNSIGNNSIENNSIENNPIENNPIENNGTANKDAINKEMLIKIEDDETAIALLENGKLVEIYLERLTRQRLLGNIYMGQVENILPGMQAAFVNIGLNKNSFLYVEDAKPKTYNSQNEYFCDNNDAPEEDREIKENNEIRQNSGRKEEKTISQLLKKRQQIMVQICKEPVGSKGARVTTNITLPGRYLVLMPMNKYIAVSRRIEDSGECQRLKDLVSQLLPPEMGVIIRTVANGVGRDELGADLKALIKQWRRIQGKAAKSPAASLIHRDLDMLQRVIRDSDYENINRLIVNSPETREKLEEIISEDFFTLEERVFIKEEDIFEKYNIYGQLKEALQRRVWLKSGGYIVFDQTEALTIIDVNTGKYVGETNLADTVSKTNMEAVKEISRQLRLRNTGGIIIVDFIDMDSPLKRAELLAYLEEELKKDRTRVTVLGMTQLGLVEMTRKKLGHELSYVMEKECPYCSGKGRVFSEATVAHQIKLAFPQEAQNTQGETILIQVPKETAAYLESFYGRQLAALEEKWAKKIVIEGVLGLPPESFTLRPLD